MLKISTTIATLTAVGFMLGLTSPGMSEDEALIREAAVDYMEGWYDGNADRMERSLHPDLAKRVVMPNARTKKGKVEHMSAMKLVQATRRHKQKPTPTHQRTARVTVYEIYGNAASAKAQMSDWVDYMHLVKLDGKWKVVNVLWEPTPEAKKRWGFPEGL